MTQEANEVAVVETGDRFEQMALTNPKVDREAGVLHRVHIMGRHSNHGYEYGLTSQKAVQGRWEGMPVGIDHAYDSSPLKIEQTWGEIIQPIEVDEQGTWGSLRYLKSHPRTEQILEAAEKSMVKIGLSAVTRVRREQNKIVEDFMPVRLDVVINPATVPSFFEQTKETTSPPTVLPQVQTLEVVPTAIDADIASLRAEVAGLKAQLLKFEQSRTVVTPPDIKATVEAVTSGIDLKKFWND